MNGCYEALQSGKASEGLLDLTGGLTEVYYPPQMEGKDLFEVIRQALRNGAFLACNTVSSLSFSLCDSKYWGGHFAGDIFKCIFLKEKFEYLKEIILEYVSLGLTDKTINIGSGNGLVLNRRKSHYLKQWWPRSLTPYGITRPQWVKAIDMKSGIDIQIIFLCDI